MIVTKDEVIQGVIIKKARICADPRGWLLECFRHDEISKELYPAMSYVSMTKPGIARGPHEHNEQTDCFCFIGSSAFRLFLWDNREKSASFGKEMAISIEEGSPTIAIIPPHVVHAYKNIGTKEGLVLNFANRLYAGWGKRDPVDEIRYENGVNCKFKIY